MAVRALLASMLAVPACRIEIDERTAQQVNRESVAQEDILAVLTDYYAAFSALDSARFVGHFWPGADITTRWQPPGEDALRVMIQPVEEFIAQWPLGPGTRSVFEETLDEADVTVTGNLAQAWVRYAARFGEPGDITEWQGIDAFTLMRHEGVWRIVELAFSAEP